METDRSRKGWIFDIKRFAVHDGPGIRTTVFLKGCGLSCAWCHNPESIHAQPELLLNPSRCIGCGACVEVCPNDVHSFNESGEHLLRRDRCNHCGKCVDACYSEALLMAGRETTVGEVVDILAEDRSFYETSGGGVTLSGGEPLLQNEFALSLLRCCKEEGFHTAVDTSGHLPWEAIEKALPYIDLVLYDLKSMDSEVHKQYTGSGNDRLLANLKRIDESGVPIEIRMPIIPTVNDTNGSIESAGRFLTALNNIKEVRLLAYHRYAGSKYLSVGRPNHMPDVESPSKKYLREIAGRMRKFEGITVTGID